MIHHSMKLVSIISAWADTLSLLPKCIENHLQFCDGVIVCWSSTSNHGIKDDRMLEFVATQQFERAQFQQIEPLLHRAGSCLQNETRKRNAGIQLARQNGFTHYIIADADEFYRPEDVGKDKAIFSHDSVRGVVCKIRVFIGKPTLWCVDQNTVIPFIHKLDKETYVGKFNEYPYAYKATGHAQIDPSRRPNEIKGIVMSDTECYHMSYVRENIDLKIRNSTANLVRMEQVIKQDIRLASVGYRSLIYHQHLKECENHFGL